MTLRALLKVNGETELGLPPTDTSLKTTLAFAFDAGYLEPFKTLIGSLVKQGSYIDSPIAIYSTDPSVFRDRFVKACIDKAVHIKGKRLSVLEEMAKESVQRPDRAAWNRGTFLKWAIFEEQDTENLLFLDADMIVLRPIETPFERGAKRPFSCSPQFQRTIKPSREESDSERVLALLNDILRGRHTGGHRSRVNSGVLHLSGRMLTSDFFDEISKFARTRTLINEQSFFSEYFQEHRDEMMMMRSSLNFQEAYLTALPHSDQRNLLEKIDILHFAGPGKPWVFQSNQMPSLGKLLWYRHDFERKNRFRAM